MLISYKLLQTFFTKPLPKVEEVADALTFHAFEIEGTEQKGDDMVIDVKVLPNRTHDCLSHRGIAREISAILELPLAKEKEVRLKKAGAPSLSVEVKDKHCNRYAGLVIEGVRVGPSPEWLSSALLSLGQRSINNIVDSTNYVMFMLGQPLHAFDYAKVEGAKIVVRAGKKEEKLTTLDGKEVALDNVMVIADEKTPLAVAGIKGGTKAEVSEGTTTIILESANFDPSAIRRTAQGIGIKTDASKRFESGLTPHLAEEALRRVAVLIVEIAGGKSGEIVDVFPKVSEAVEIVITLAEVNKILGTSLKAKDVSGVWKRLKFEAKEDGDTFSVVPPSERLDLAIKEDLIEEVGRLVGYDALEAKMPVESLVFPEENRAWRSADIVREVMISAGFSEVYTYSFLGEGEVEVANPVAADKKYLRNNLMNGLKLAASENLKRESEVRIFELGHIFGKEKGTLKEEHSFAGVMGFAKRKDVQLKEDFFFLKGVLENVFEALGIEGLRWEKAGGELVASVRASDVWLGMMSVIGF